MKWNIVILVALCSILACSGQVIISDAYNIPGSGTGFALNSGVNTGINPPTTRLGGFAAASLRYLPTYTKPTTAFSITSNKLRVAAAANPGRVVLSSDGASSFNFASALGSASATPANPKVYDLTIKIANNSAGVQRCSFALGTIEGDANTWAFGLQLYRSVDTANYYTIGKRIDTTASGLASDLNSFITYTTAGTYGTEISFLLRVTDAGTESTGYNSRVRVSLDGGLTWIYDTASDPELTKGFHFNSSARHIMWDVAGDAGTVTYDDFSVSPVPIAAVLISPLTNTANLGASPILTAAVSNKAPDNVTVTFYGREAPTTAKGRDFMIAVLPDTQNYVKSSTANQKFISQIEWIVTNRVSQNIVYVAHLGDVVQNGDILSGSGNIDEWRNATNALYRLENPTRTLLARGIPYGVAVGNHDQEPNGDENGTTTYFNQYFGISHFAGRPYYGGSYGSNNDSHYDLFSAAGMDFIVFYFEFGRYGSGVLGWATDVLATNQNRRVIAVTHYAGSDSTPSNLSPAGQAIYDALKVNPNFFMMLGGHVFSQGGEGSRASSYSGRTIRTFISDYQSRTAGGNGWMRLMYFSPSNNLVTIKTYSPSLKQYETDADSQMSFAYNMDKSSGSIAVGDPFEVLGVTNGAPGSLVKFPFPGLEPRTSYEWYVRVQDSVGNSAFSSIGRFTTSLNSAPSVTSRTVDVAADQPTSLTLTGSDANGDALSFWNQSAPLHGLVDSVDPDHGLISYVPARGYRGSDVFTYQASDGVAVSGTGTITLNVLAPADTNSNGLPDSWEASYGVTDAGADDDQDGLNNLAEFLSGTNPTNAASKLTMLTPHLEETGEVRLSWTSVGGTRYRVQYSEGDAQGGFTGVFSDLVQDANVEMDPASYGSDSVFTFTDEASVTNAARYYRVKVAP